MLFYKTWPWRTLPGVRRPYGRPRLQSVPERSEWEDALPERGCVGGSALKATYFVLWASAIADEIISSLTPFFRRLLINAETSTLLSKRSRSARNP